MTNKKVTSCNGRDFYPHDTSLVNDRYCAPQNPKASLLFSLVTFNKNQSLVYDIEDSYSLLFKAFLVAFLFSVVFTLLMFFMSGIVFWVITICSVLLVISFGVLIIIEANHEGVLNDGLNSVRIKYLNFVENHKIFLTVLGVFCILFGLFILWVFFKDMKAFKKMLSLISESFKIAYKNSLVVFCSIFSVVLQFFIYYVALEIFIKMHGMGTRKEKQEQGEPFP